MSEEKPKPDERTDQPRPPSPPPPLPPAVDANNTTSRLSPWKRLAFIICFALFASFAFQFLQQRQPKVVHASRYSKDFKFRPAASPVITETLKDGRVRLRGALPTPSSKPTPEATAKKKRRSSGTAKSGRASGGKARRRRSPVVANY